MTTTRPRRAALYLRISSDPQGRRLGVDRQRKALRDLARHLDWGIGEIFEENDTSAFRDNPRPEYNRMLAACEHGDCDAILVYSVDRLTRRLVEFATFMAWREQHAVPFATTEGDNSETSNGRMILNIKASLAQGESERIRERVTAAMAQRAQRGLPKNGGTRPFGWKPGGVKLDKREATVLRDCAERILAGESLRSVTLDLNKRGIPTPTGGQWATSTLRRILMNPRLAGLVVYRRQILEDAEATWEPIISRDTHEQLVAFFESRKNGARGAQFTYLLTGGIAICQCGGRMNGKPKHGKRYYTCTARPGTDWCGRLAVVADGLEAYVRELTFAALDSPKLARAISSRTRTDAVGKALTALIEARRKLAALEDKYANDELSRDAYLRNRGKLAHLVGDAEREHERLAAADKLPRVPTSDLARKLWDERGIDWRRNLIGTLIERVTVKSTPMNGHNYFDPNRVTVSWRY